MKITNKLSKEFINFILHKKIGKGIHRTVYSSNILEEYVIKISNGKYNHANVAEWLHWVEVQSTPIAKYFAPCEYISENGNILIQAKCDTSYIPTNKKLLLPECIDDISTKNLGYYKGNLVVFDYAYMHCNFSEKLINIKPLV